MKAKTPIAYVGGKLRIADWIVSFFPPHTCYVEPFCGGCSVLCAKEPSRVEVINDIDSELVNFLIQVRRNPKRFIKEISLYPYSRYLFEKWKKEPMSKSPFRRAIRWFYFNRCGFVGLNIKTGWGYGRLRNKAKCFQSAINRIQSFSDRLRLVQIENKNFRDVIKRYDSKETLFYCDPPRLGSNYYTHPFTEKDHKDLADLLHKIKGKVVLSYYPHPLIDKLYRDFYQIKKEIVKCYFITRLNPAKKKPRAIELLLMNFKPDVK